MWYTTGMHVQILMDNEAEILEGLSIEMKYVSSFCDDT